MKKILIATGGTGGHISPALVLLNYLKNSKNYKVYLSVDNRGLDFIKKYNYYYHDLFIVRASSIKKNSICSLFFSCCKIMLGFVDSIFLIIKIKPNYIVSFGGYSTFPVLVVATLFRIPIILHEQNSVIGKVNFIFSKMAKFLAISFPNTIYKGRKLQDIKPINNKFKVTGLPIKRVESNKETKKDKIIISIFGGSLGAKALSEVIPKAFSLLDEKIKKKMEVYHQCREEYIKEVEVLWKNINIKYTISPFFNNVMELINNSSLVISRSGAASVFEICSLGKPAIYIPFKQATDNHQYYNAVNAINREIIVEDEITEIILVDKINYLLDNIEKYKEIIYPFDLEAEKEIEKLILDID